MGHDILGPLPTLAELDRAALLELKELRAQVGRLKRERDFARTDAGHNAVDAEKWNEQESRDTDTILALRAEVKDAESEVERLTLNDRRWRVLAENWPRVGICTGTLSLDGVPVFGMVALADALIAEEEGAG